jgi:hypothetical protein
LNFNPAVRRDRSVRYARVVQPRLDGSECAVRDLPVEVALYIDYDVNPDGAGEVLDVYNAISVDVQYCCYRRDLVAPKVK